MAGLESDAIGSQANICGPPATGTPAAVTPQAGRSDRQAARFACRADGAPRDSRDAAVVA
jgi:hypothetical protein